jgi:photosystem II stability/assembly factor-like uncharacterized protein
MSVLNRCLVNCTALAYSPEQEMLGVWDPITMPLKSAYYTAGFSSPEEGWAFGGYDPARWNGQMWLQSPSLKELRNVISVKFLSADNGWAVGDQGMILHWDGNQWARVVAPTSQKDELFGVDFASSQLGWAVGVTGIDQPSTLHGVMLEWNGTEWVSLDRLAAKYSLFAIDVLSTTEGWAVASPVELLHWNGQQWELYKNSTSESLEFNSIAVISPDDAWMVGEILNTNEGTIWHWDGNQWAEFQRTRLGLFSISMVSPNFGWAVGGNGLWKKMDNGSLLMHWNGQEWKEYPISTTVPLQYVWAPNTTDGWIFGGGPALLIRGEYSGVAFRYHLVETTTTLSPTASVVPSATFTPIPATIAPTLVPTAIPNQPSPTSTNVFVWFLVAALFILLVIIVLFWSRQRN